MSRILLLLSVLFCINSLALAQRDDEPVTDYYSPCKGGTDATIFSWHGVEQDGKPPLDPTRQAYHFECENREIYAIYGGEVWGSTQRWGGLILVDDAEHKTCMVYLGMESVEVKQGDIIEAGAYMGQYLYRPHITVLNVRCEIAKWYNRAARQYEIPVAFIEIGEVIAPDLTHHMSIPFVSENPSGDE